MQKSKQDSKTVKGDIRDNNDFSDIGNSNFSKSEEFKNVQYVYNNNKNESVFEKNKLNEIK